MFIENLTGEKAASFPDGVAIVDFDSGVRLTWPELFDRTSFLADFMFRRNKVNPSDVVLCGSRDAVFNASLFFACLSVGAVLARGEGLSADEVGMLSPRLSFGLPGGLPGTLEDLGFRSGADPVFEVETPEGSPALLTRESEGVFRIVSHSMLSVDSIASVLSDGILRSDMACCGGGFFDLEAISLHLLPVLVAGGSVAFGNAVDEGCVTLASGDAAFWGRHAFPEARSRKFILRGFGDASYFPAKAGLDPVFVCGRAGTRAFIGTRVTGGGVVLGTAGFNLKARVVDAGGADAEEGVPGRLSMRGCSLFSGFWNNPAVTSSCLRKGWTDLGVGAVRRDGVFYLTEVSHGRA